MEGLTLIDAAILAASGLLAGAVNAVAGGGTFFTFSALVATGLPPVVANATSAVAVTPGNLASTYAYRREIADNLGRFRALAIVSLLGGLIGAFILTRIDNASFRVLVPWLLLVATLLFAFSPLIVRAAAGLRGGETGEPSAVMWAIGLLIQFVTAIYGGFFGAGMGIVMLAAMAITEGDDYHRINAAKNLCSTLLQGVAIVLFIWAGLVRWPQTLIVGVAAIAGGYFGVGLGRKVPPRVMRGFIVTVGLGLAAYFFVRG